MDMMQPHSEQDPAAEAAETTGAADPKAKLKQARALIDEALASMGEDPATSDRMSAEEAFSSGFAQG